MSNILLFIPSGGEILLIFLVVLILFGSDKIPDLARMLGKGMREFRKATDDIKREFNSSTQDISNDFSSESNKIKGDIDTIKSSIDNKLAMDNPYEENHDEPLIPGRTFIDDDNQPSSPTPSSPEENDEKNP